MLRLISGSQLLGIPKMESKMKDRLNEENIKAQFDKVKHKAEAMMDNPEQLKKVAESAWEKTLGLRGPLEEVWEQLKLMISLVKEWLAGNYKEVPTASIVAIVAGLIYLLSPIDLIPDFIPVLGYLDDIFVLGVVFTQVAKDLETFARWQAAGSKSAEDMPTDSPIEPSVVAQPDASEAPGAKADTKPDEPKDPD
jgi:uncharacterized membrane protein YkvA (DUF1232 family)